MRMLAILLISLSAAASDTWDYYDTQPPASDRGIAVMPDPTAGSSTTWITPLHGTGGFLWTTVGPDGTSSGWAKPLDGGYIVNETR